MTSRIDRTRWRALAVAVMLGLSLGTVIVAPVLAHSELVTPTPADGSTVSGDPLPTISGTYSETLDPDGSSLVLVDASGTTVATGGVADASQPTKDMAIESVPVLAAGKYTVKSTTKSAQDGDIDRKTWSFTVEAAAASPSAEPSAAGPSATVAPTAQPSAIASATATPAVVPSATPIASAGDAGSNTGSSSDVLLPIIAALAIVAIVAGFLLVRRRPAGPA